MKVHGLIIRSIICKLSHKLICIKMYPYIMLISFKSNSFTTLRIIANRKLPLHNSINQNCIMKSISWQTPDGMHIYTHSYHQWKKKYRRSIKTCWHLTITSRQFSFEFSWINLEQILFSYTIYMYTLIMMIKANKNVTPVSLR